MVAKVLAFLLAASAVATAQTTPGAPGPPSTAKPQIVQLYMSETRALAMLRIADAAPFPVVFDTGTNGNLIDLAVATRLSLPRVGPSTSIDGSTGKPVTGYATFIKNARLGGVGMADAEATAMAYDLNDEIGIVGPNSFPDRLVEMDGPRSRLVIRAKMPGAMPAGEAMPYLGKGEAALPSAVLDFGGLKVAAILDTGNDSVIILPTSYKDRVTLVAPPVIAGHAISAAGQQPIYRAQLAGTVRLANVSIVRPWVMFMDGGRPNVGLPVLRRIKVVYDHSASRSWIVSPPVVIQ